MDTLQLTQIMTAIILFISEILPFISVEGNGVFHYFLVILASLKNVKIPETVEISEIEQNKPRKLFSMFHK